MSDAAILHDALRAAGYERITAWHLRCVEAYLTQRFRNHWEEAHERLGFDLNNTPDELHEMALSDNTERTQRLVAAREWWMSQDADFFPVR